VTKGTLEAASWGCQRRGRLGWEFEAAPVCFEFIPRRGFDLKPHFDQLTCERSFDDPN